MLFTKKKGESTDLLHSLNYMNEKTILTGNIDCETDFRLDGTLTGDINCKAKLVIGITGKVKGDLRAKNAFVQGLVKGNIITEEMLVISETAVIEGDIFTKQFTAKEGSKMNGQLTMSDKVPGETTLMLSPQHEEKEIQFQGIVQPS
jgi:cytoskeletal protein CcmA (bactofilin family)